MKASTTTILLSILTAAALADVPLSVEGGPDSTLTVVNNGLTAYRFNGTATNNPTINLIRGRTYQFNVNASGHPFYIKTARTTGTDDQYSDGVTGQGTTVGSLTFTVPSDAPSTLFYQCSIHAAMGGTFNIGDSALSVVNNGLSSYRFNGSAIDNPTINLVRGRTYHFSVNASGHPFHIKTVSGPGTGDQYTNGVTGQGVTVGTLIFAVPGNAPSTLFYNCSLHGSMAGTFNIADPVDVPGPRILPDVAWLGTATPNPAREEAVFRMGLPRSAAIDFAIFDGSGRRIRGLWNGTVDAGVHLVHWNGRDDDGRLAPSGSYFYRLRFEGRQLGGRFSLIR